MVFIANLSLLIVLVPVISKMIYLSLSLCWQLGLSIPVAFRQYLPSRLFFSQKQVLTRKTIYRPICNGATMFPFYL